MVLEKSVYPPFSQLTRLLAGVCFIESSHCDVFRLYKGKTLDFFNNEL